MVEPARQFTATNSTGYRFGFNGKEKSDEINGSGVDYDYGARVYDARIAKFLSVDPLQKKYPELTPYQFASNSPLAGIDLDGGELKILTDWLADKAKAVGCPRLSGFVRSFGGLDFNSRLYNLASHTLKGDFSTIKQEAWNHTGFGVIQSLSNTTYNAVKGDKESQGQLLGIAVQVIGGRGSAEGEVPAPWEQPTVPEFLIAKTQAEANGGVTTESLGPLNEPGPVTTSPNYEALYLKYKSNRPSLSQNTINQVWENAKDANGNVYDPHTGELLTWDKFKSRYEQWHMGHRTGHEYRTLLIKLKAGEITEEQFKKDYNDPKNYKPESPAENMSHKHEQKKQTQTTENK